MVQTSDQLVWRIIIHIILLFIALLILFQVLWPHLLCTCMLAAGTQECRCGKPT